MIPTIQPFDRSVPDIGDAFVFHQTKRCTNSIEKVDGFCLAGDRLDSHDAFLLGRPKAEVH